MKAITAYGVFAAGIRAIAEITVPFLFTFHSYLVYSCFFRSSSVKSKSGLGRSIERPQTFGFFPPSSPFIALMKDGQPVYVLERRNIEGRTASAIAYDLVQAYHAYCSNGADLSGNAAPGPDRDREEPTAPGQESDTFRSIL